MRTLCLITILFTASCYPKIKIEGFDKEKWVASYDNCQSEKKEIAQLIMKQEDKILGKGQAEVKALLGQPEENELYRRNQKFFHYAITPGDSCDNIKSQERLSILFDALDRAKEVLITD